MISTHMPLSQAVCTVKARHPADPADTESNSPPPSRLVFFDNEVTNA